MKNKQIQFVFLISLLILQTSSGLSAKKVITDGINDVMDIDDDKPVDFDAIDITEAAYLQLAQTLGLSITFVGNITLSKDYEYYYTIDLLQNNTGIKYANLKLQMKNNVSSVSYSWDMNGTTQIDTSDVTVSISSTNKTITWSFYDDPLDQAIYYDKSLYAEIEISVKYKGDGANYEDTLKFNSATDTNTRDTPLIINLLFLIPLLFIRKRKN